MSRTPVFTNIRHFRLLRNGLIRLLLPAGSSSARTSQGNVRGLLSFGDEHRRRQTQHQCIAAYGVAVVVIPVALQPETSVR